MFIELITDDPQQYFSWILFATFSICVHESAHAWLAVRFGDETPRAYISLNPMRQMGRASLVMLLLVGVAWGAVPVNPRGLGGRGRNALVYLAGPLANLGLCAIFALLSQTSRLWDAGLLMHLFHYGSYVNGALCLLNLCPVPPLDGFGVIRSLWLENQALQNASNQFAVVGILMLWVTPIGGLLFKYGGMLADFFDALWLAPFTFFS